MDIAFPFAIDQLGNIDTAARLDHIRQMVEQVLFTNPGERVNRPDFGCGMAMFLFRSPTDEVLTALQGILQGQLQRWLGDLVRIENVAVRMADSSLAVTVRYTLLTTQQTVIAQFQRGAA